MPEVGTEGLTPGFGAMPGPVADTDALLKRTDIISEYVIITTPALTVAVQPLLNAKSGWPHYAMVATTQTISAEFPAGSLKDSIRGFLSWAWGNWRVPPRFVVLAGDTAITPRFGVTKLYGDSSTQ